MLWDWLTDTTNAATVGAIGLIVTTIAFVVTIWQVVVTRLEVRRAVKEIDAFKARLRSEEAVRLVVKIRERSGQAIVHIRSGSTRKVFDALSDLHTAVSRLGSLSDIVGVHAKEISDSALSISNFVTAHERTRGVLPEQDRKVALLSMRVLSQVVGKVDGHMKDNH